MSEPQIKQIKGFRRLEEQWNSGKEERWKRGKMEKWNDGMVELLNDCMVESHPIQLVGGTGELKINN